MSLLFVIHNLSKKVQRGCRTCFSIFFLLVRIDVVWKEENCGTLSCFVKFICYTYVYPDESEFITIFRIRKNRYRYWILVRSNNSEVIVYIKLYRKRKIERWNSKRVLWSIFASLLAQSPGLGMFIEIFEYNIIIILHVIFLSYCFFYIDVLIHYLSSIYIIIFM